MVHNTCKTIRFASCTVNIAAALHRLDLCQHAYSMPGSLVCTNTCKTMHLVSFTANTAACISSISSSALPGCLQHAKKPCINNTCKIRRLVGSQLTQPPPCTISTSSSILSTRLQNARKPGMHNTCKTMGLVRFIDIAAALHHPDQQQHSLSKLAQHARKHNTCTTRCCHTSF